MLRSMNLCFSVCLSLFLGRCVGGFVYGGLPYDDLGKTYPVSDFRETYFLIQFPKEEELNWLFPIQETVTKSKKLERSFFNLKIEQDNEHGLWHDVGQPALKYMTLNPESHYWDKHCGFKLESRMISPMYSEISEKQLKFIFFPGGQYKIKAPSGKSSFRFTIMYPNERLFGQPAILKIFNIELRKEQTLVLLVGTYERELSYTIAPTDKTLPICKVDNKLISIFGQ